MTAVYCYFIVSSLTMVLVFYERRRLFGDQDSSVLIGALLLGPVMLGANFLFDWLWPAPKNRFEILYERLGFYESDGTSSEEIHGKLMDKEISVGWGGCLED